MGKGDTDREERAERNHDAQVMLAGTIIDRSLLMKLLNNRVPLAAPSQPPLSPSWRSKRLSSRLPSSDFTASSRPLGFSLFRRHGADDVNKTLVASRAALQAGRDGTSRALSLSRALQRCGLTPLVP
eukprot:5236085-Prymnesium_polylepis.1